MPRDGETNVTDSGETPRRIQPPTNISGMRRDLYFTEPPNNLEAEAALLAALMFKNALLDEVRETALRCEHFYDHANGRVYEAICELADRGQIANAITLKNYFQGDRKLYRDDEQAAYLARLAASIVTTANCRDYARTIVQCWLHRQLIVLGQETIDENLYFDTARDIHAITANVEARLTEISGMIGSAGLGKRGRRDNRSVTFSALHMLEDAWKSGTSLRGPSTGIDVLDEATGGLPPGFLVIIGGRPGKGKTDLALTLTRNVARRGGAVAYFNHEMTAEQATQRGLAAATGVSVYRQNKGEFTGDDFARIVRAGEEMADLPIYHFDDPAMSPSYIRREVLRLKRQGVNVVLVVIDHLGLVDLSGMGPNRRENLEEATRGFKALAKEADTCVLVLSQLSRKCEEREDKRPMLSDLRETGAIEQDADVVMFVYRDAYYRRPKTGPEAFGPMSAEDRCAEVIIPKQRFGPPRTVELDFDGEKSVWTNPY